MNKTPRIIFQILQLLLVLVYAYFLYSNVLSFFRFKQGRLYIYNYHYTILTLPQAFFYIFYFLCFLLSLVGIAKKKKWANYLFHIFNIPVLIILSMACWMYYMNEGHIPPVYILALLLSLAFTILVNAKRVVLFPGIKIVRLVDIGIIIVGIAALAGMGYAVLK